MAKKQKTALTKGPENSLATTEVDQMFGGSDIPVGSVMSQLILNKNKPVFEHNGREIESLKGNTLDIKPLKVFFDKKFDPANPTPPTCCSSDGLVPDSGTEIQADTCSSCPKNVHNEELGCRPCKSRTFIYFLKEGDAVPMILNLSPTNLSKKAGPNRIMTFPARAVNMASAAGVGEHYQLVKCKLTLQQVMFGNGPASTLSVECLEPVTDMEKIKVLAEKTQRARKEHEHVFQTVVEAGEAAEAEDNIPI